MKLKFLIISLSVILLSACKQDVQSGQQTENITQNKSTHIYAKAHAPVSMNYSFVNTAELNQALELKLNFKVSRDTPKLKIVYHTRAALRSLDNTQQFEFYNLQQGDTKSIEINIMPLQPGKQKVYITATLDINGTGQSRAFVVPVDIPGDVQQLKAEQINNAHGMKYIPGQNVISMPATEVKN